jgi:hypothetical protein
MKREAARRGPGGAQRAGDGAVQLDPPVASEPFIQVIAIEHVSESVAHVDCSSARIDGLSPRQRAFALGGAAAVLYLVPQVRAGFAAPPLRG